MRAISHILSDMESCSGLDNLSFNPTSQAYIRGKFCGFERQSANGKRKITQAILPQRKKRGTKFESNAGGRRFIKRDMPKVAHCFNDTVDPRNGSGQIGYRICRASHWQTLYSNTSSIQIPITSNQFHCQEPQKYENATEAGISNTCSVPCSAEMMSLSVTSWSGIVPGYHGCLVCCLVNDLKLRYSYSLPLGFLFVLRRA
jgi:hypothetical protein